MAAVRKWQFKAKFRANTYGWRASSLAISRLKEAASEIRSVAKSDPVAAGDGAVSLMERIWPAFQGIDTSSGALGAAVFRTIDELMPILAVAPADHTTRRKWLVSMPTSRASIMARSFAVFLMRIDHSCSPDRI